MIPCRFCGIQPEIVEEQRGKNVFYRVKCPSCGIRTALHRTPFYAYKEWEPDNRK